MPHDTAKIIELQGGDAKFLERLDLIIDQVSLVFPRSELRGLNEVTQGYFDVTDEPGQQIPYMYHYANRPGHSIQRSRQTIDKFFTLAIDGLPGNDGQLVVL